MNPVLLSSLSPAVLIGVIALGFLKKWNVGILSFGAAMLMGMAAGMTQKQIVAGFNTSLFVILLGSMFLFSIAQLNGTMDSMTPAEYAAGAADDSQIQKDNCRFDGSIRSELNLKGFRSFLVTKPLLGDD